MPTEKLILVVDDVPDWQITLNGMLSDEGYQVHVADSSDKALSLARSIRFDLAVIDIRLDETVEEDKSGVDLARRLRTLYPELGIIMITGYNTRLIMDTAYYPDPGGQRVIDDYIPKTQSDELTTRVRELLES